MIGEILGLTVLELEEVGITPTGDLSIIKDELAIGIASLTATSLVGAGILGATTLTGVLKKSSSTKEEKVNVEEEKVEKVVKNHKLNTNTVLAMSALGIAIANSDGELLEEYNDDEDFDEESSDEKDSLDFYVECLSASSYPEDLKIKVKNMLKEPPTYNEALKYLEKANIEDDITIRNILSVVMLADGKVLEEEKAFLKAFDEKVNEIAKSKKEKLEKIEYRNEKEIEELKNIDSVIAALGISGVSGALLGSTGIISEKYNKEFYNKQKYKKEENIDIDHISPLKSTY